VKPVPLAVLAQKPVAAIPQRVDPKVPTAKNVNDLKSALAAALGNKPASTPVPMPAPNQTSAATQVSATATSAITAPIPVPIKPVLPVPPAPISPGEVPEDVLKKVLN
jgi:hypothetical protein